MAGWARDLVGLVSFRQARLPEADRILVKSGLASRRLLESLETR